MAFRQLTAEEVQIIAGSRYKDLPVRWYDWFGPSYQEVRYRAALNRVDYEKRDTFTGLGSVSPSDCIWMVPSGIGALET